MRTLALLLVALLAGCASHDGHFERGARSRTVIDGAHARVIKQLQVSYGCNYALGVALDDEDLYQRAGDALRKEAAFDGPMALANVISEETLEGVWPLYFTRRLTLTAQVVRFAPPLDE